MSGTGRSIQRIDGKVFFDRCLYYYGKVGTSSEPRFIEAASVSANNAQKVEFFERAAAVESVDMRLRVSSPVPINDTPNQQDSSEVNAVLREIQIPPNENGNFSDTMSGAQGSSQSSLILRSGNRAGTIGHYHLTNGMSTTDEEHDLELISQRRRVRRSLRARERVLAQDTSRFDSATAMFILTNEQISSIDNTDSLDELEDNLEQNMILIRRRRRQILREEERLENLGNDSDAENTPPARSRRRITLQRDSD